MRRWSVTLLGIAMMAGAVFGFDYYVKRAEAMEELVEAVMPVRLIAAGERLDETMLRRVPIPEAAVPMDAILDEQRIIGLTAMVTLGPNEPIAAWKLAERQLSPRTGERYISFPADTIRNVGNMLRRGDRVDVWVELERPLILGGSPVGAVKVISGLIVASIRTEEGTEVQDAPMYDAAFLSAAKQRDNIRAHANGKAVVNTFIMDDEIYEAYTLAALVGNIKLALPEMSLAEDNPAGVTSEFLNLRESLIESVNIR